VLILLVGITSGSSWYAVAVAAGLGAVTGNGRLGYSAAGFTAPDVPQTLAVLVNLWFYVTPIIYPATMIPEGWRVYILLNYDGDRRSLSRLVVGEVKHWGNGELWCCSLLVLCWLKSLSALASRIC